MMALFSFGKKKDEEKRSSACACSVNETDSAVSACCLEGKEEKNCCIKVLGTGCKACRTQYENVKQAVNDMGLSAEVEYITDMQKVMSYGVMSMPAIVVHEKVVAMGRGLQTAEVISLLQRQEER